ncbi:MAG: hypothetical protein DRP62_07900, partial [Planctomycetota bacterium]
AFRFIFSVGLANELAQQEMGAIMAEKTLSCIKKYLQTRHAPWGGYEQTFCLKTSLISVIKLIRFTR